MVYLQTKKSEVWHIFEGLGMGNFGIFYGNLAI
jgi:hypothetical protein